MSQSPRPRALIVGTGFIGPAHLEALRRLGVPVAGLVERDAETAARKARELGIERAYPSYEAALADPAVSVVHLAVPNALHAPYAEAALAAGKHVVCEKPLAATSAESERLARLARASGLVAAVNYNLRFYPLVREARERVARGDIGAPFLVHGAYLQDWLLLDTDWNWRLEPAAGGELRAVADIGTHWLDMVAYATGRRIEAVFADFATMHPVRRRPVGPVETFTAAGGAPASGLAPAPVTSEDAAVILLRFEGGARGSLVVSQVSAGRKNSLRFEIDGSASSMAWDSEEPNSLWIGRRNEPNGLLMKDPSLLTPAAARLSAYPGGHQEGYADTIARMFAEFYRYVEAGDFSAPRGFPTFDDGHAEMLLCDALLESSKSGAWVAVPPVKGGKA
ncbi:MAG: Gfo/Idh/MocA family oxidoreductase [Spirochaetaceae bacterium]|nr:Gfo/Idh/MocA family oxidoreductase [Spirochaetaceae bacterium]